MNSNLKYEPSILVLYTDKNGNTHAVRIDKGILDSWEEFFVQVKY